jgi:N-acetylglutamate synthase
MLPPPSMPVVIELSAVGRRVVIRYRRAQPTNGPPFSDVVGELLAHDGNHLTVASRSGQVTVAVSDVVAARLVAPDRRRILALEAIASRGWRPAELIEMDGWLLRANSGWTARANSVLPLGTPARPLAELLAAAGTFYADRSLELQIQIPLPARGLLDAELAKQCWTVATPTIVLTKSLPGALVDPDAPDRTGLALPILHDDEPSARWRAGYHARDGDLPAHAVGLLARHDRVTFASLVLNGETVGIARGVVDDGWLGVTAVEVATPVQRSGIASALMSSLEHWALAQDATQAYVQVAEANTGARALYERLGYTEHHRYHYRRPPIEAP